MGITAEDFKEYLRCSDEASIEFINDCDDDEKSPGLTNGRLRRSSIYNDIERMFPRESPVYLQSNEFKQKLGEVLEAFCNFRPNVSYVQGMCYLAAMLLVYMEQPVAFACLVNLLEIDLFSSYILLDIDDIQKKYHVTYFY